VREAGRIYETPGNRLLRSHGRAGRPAVDRRHCGCRPPTPDLGGYWTGRANDGPLASARSTVAGRNGITGPGSCPLSPRPTPPQRAPTTQPCDGPGDAGMGGQNAAVAQRRRPFQPGAQQRGTLAATKAPSPRQKPTASGPAARCWCGEGGQLRRPERRRPVLDSAGSLPTDGPARRAVESPGRGISAHRPSGRARHPASTLSPVITLQRARRRGLLRAHLGMLRPR